MKINTVLNSENLLYDHNYTQVMTGLIILIENESQTLVLQKLMNSKITMASLVTNK